LWLNSIKKALYHSLGPLALGGLRKKKGVSQCFDQEILFVFPKKAISGGLKNGKELGFEAVLIIA